MRVYQKHAGDDAKLQIKFHWPNIVACSVGFVACEQVVIVVLVVTLLSVINSYDSCFCDI